MKYYDLIEKYKNGEMNDEEKDKFRKMLQENENLREELNLLKDVDAFLSNKEEVELRLKLSKFIKNYTSSKRKSKTLSIQIISIAASIILVVGFSFIAFTYFNGNSNEKIFKDYYHPYEYEFSVRSDEITKEELKFQMAMEKYNARNYKEAQDLFKEILLEDQKYIVVKLLLSICYLENNNLKLAIQLLTELKNEENLLFSETVNWYLALCKLNDGEIQESKMLFSELSSYENYYAKNAKKILTKIK